MSRAGPLVLDRMLLEEAGPDPAGIAAALHDQLGHATGAAPVQEIAGALDIVEVRVVDSRSFAGALVTSPERDEGIIAVASASSPRRRRFTIAHELGHFLSLHHEPTGPDGRFACRREDLAGPWQMPSNVSRHQLQEAQANRFAIELLAPARLVRPALRGIPDLERVVALAGELAISREACARRCSELNETPSALVFSQDGRVRYVERHPEFPFVSLSNRDRAPALPRAADASGLSAHEEADWGDWLNRRGQSDLVVQSLHQQNGFAITLLSIDSADTAEDEDD